MRNLTLKTRILALAASLAVPVCAFGQARVEDVFKGFNQQLDQPSTDPTKFFLIVGGVVAAVLVVVWFTQRREKQAALPTSLNHPGKLLKEIARSVDLRPAEIKQLKLLAETQDDVEFSLTLLLCPSLLAKSIKTQPDKMDRAVVQQLARRLMNRQTKP